MTSNTFNLPAVMKEAEDHFREYADQHANKSPPATDKMIRNMRMADRLRLVRTTMRLDTVDLVVLAPLPDAVMAAAKRMWQHDRYGEMTEAFAGEQAFAEDDPALDLPESVEAMMAPGTHVNDRGPWEAPNSLYYTGDSSDLFTSEEIGEYQEVYIGRAIAALGVNTALLGDLSLANVARHVENTEAQDAAAQNPVQAPEG